jgi:hypothetical protein
MSYRDRYNEIDWSVPIPEGPRPERARGPRSAMPGPMIISDVMPEQQCMANGKYYSSKSAMRKAHAALGFTEVGNDKREPFKRPKTSRAEIKTTLEKAKARYARGERSGP